MKDYHRAGALGLAALLGFVACVLDAQGTLSGSASSSQAAGTQASSSTQGSSGSTGGTGGDGGAASSTGTGGQGGAGQGGAGQGGAPVCGGTPSPSPFVKDCLSVDACKDDRIDCMPGRDCIVTCSGPTSCAGTTTINCPSGHVCRVICEDQDACKGATINCLDASACEVVCGLNPTTCENAELNCGAGQCGAVCSGSSEPAVACGSACMCTAC